jgi:nucleoside-diphosphate-sugar epimerase
MKAVVSGLAGLIGSHLVDELLVRGYRVTGIDRQSKRPDDGNAHVLADLSEMPVGRVAKTLTTADVVFHLAAKSGVRGSRPTIEQARRRDDVVATRNLGTGPAHRLIDMVRALVVT